ncbi:MAG: efflux RND transporter permease subunit [Myxococcales bacterium]|nr:efflux RND transporter permease subunit [Myxococcales bacterium]
MSTVFYDRPRLLVTSAALLVVGGVSAWTSIVRQEDPTITNGVATITTVFPGASAERVESLVTRKIEDELRGLAEIQTLSSVSTAGVSVVTVELDENIQGADTEPAFSKIRDRIDDAQRKFPAGVFDPTFDDERFGSFTKTYAVVWRSNEPVRLGILRRLAEELQDRLRNVPGTDFVRLYGDIQEEIRVVPNPSLTRALGITVEQLAGVIVAGDAKVAAGSLRSTQEATIEISGELDSLARIREMPVATSGDGAQLRVGHVAEVTRATSEPATELASYDGMPAILVAAKMGAGVASICGNETSVRWSMRSRASSPAE